MKLIIGLGNPGEKYEKTRHNMGFMAIDKFFKQFSKGEAVWDNNTKFKSEIAQIEWQKQLNHKQKTLNENKKGMVGKNLEKAILVRPQTFMNNSGLATKLISSFYKIKPEDIWIIHDDIDLPTGALKIRFGGASAGHRGIGSIIASLGTDKFFRFRMGVGHPINRLKTGKQKTKIGNVDTYVLAGFDKGEMGKERELIKRTMKALEEALENGLQSAMNRFNSK
jgi:PTH1 family peptidyl-tRNA hydrolase